MDKNEQPDPFDPHPGQRVNIEDLSTRKYSTASTWSSSSSKRPSTASSNDWMSPTEGTWKDFTTSETWSQGPQEGIDVRDFGAKSGGKQQQQPKSKSEVEKSRKMLEKSSIGQ